MRLRPFLPLLFALLPACQSSGQPEATPTVALAFDWGPTANCFETSSPIFQVGNVPQGTVKLGFRMTDLNQPGFNHGGGTVAYQGQSDIPMGAFRYKGPCPQNGPHTYRWTVDAVDARGAVIGRGQAENPFPQGAASAAAAPG